MSNFLNNFALFCVCINIAAALGSLIIGCKSLLAPEKISASALCANRPRHACRKNKIDYNDPNVCGIAREVHLRKFQFRRAEFGPTLYWTRFKERGWNIERGSILPDTWNLKPVQ